jgi:hypothetical protein
MATALPLYAATVNWPRYTYIYYNDTDLNAYKRWAENHPQYFCRRTAGRRMASNEKMRIICCANGRLAKDITLDNVVRSSQRKHSLISRQRALATRGSVENSTSSKDPSDQKIKLRVRRPSCAASEDETFWIVEEISGGWDAVLRHDLHLETEVGVHPIGLKPQDRGQSYPICT